MTAPSAPAQQRTPAISPAPVNPLLQVGRSLALPIGSVIIAFLVGAVVIAAVGGNPLRAYEAMACGGFGLFCFGGETPALQLSYSISFIAPLLLAGVAVAVAFRAGLFNIGVQGQLIAGAILTTIVGQRLGNWPSILAIPACMLAGIIGGMVWAGIAGVLKALTGAHEVVTTIMLNYVAFNLMSYLLLASGPLQSPHSPEISLPVAPSAQLPAFVPPSVTLFGQPGSAYQADFGIVIALLAVLVYAFLMRRTALGYEIRAVGQSQRAARYAGVSVKRTIIVTMLISGAFAGLTGTILISGGALHYLYWDLVNGSTGFDGIAVSLLGQNVAVGIVLAAILFGALHAGGLVMQTDVQISSHIVDILEAVVLFTLAANFLRTVKLRFPGPGRKPGAPDGVEAVQEAFEVEVSASADGDTTTE